ncbi:MAG: VCBS repeat-containing protein [bacterium]
MSSKSPFLLSALLLPLSALAAGVTNDPPVVRAARDAHQVEVLARAQADEYFFGVGSSDNFYVPTGIDPLDCPPGSVPKVNQAYIWGMGKSGDDIYFGTLANGNTLVQSVYFETSGASTDFTQVAEGTNSYYGSLHGGTGDWRPPQLFRYNIPARKLTLLDPTLTAAAQSNLTTLGGIRAGGAASTNKYNTHRMVVLAGPPIDRQAGGVAFFVFDATTTQFVGSVVKKEYINIRRFVDVNGDLYAGVQKTNTLDGAVIRWVNNPAAAGYPFAFQEVGTLDNMGADICVHEGYLFCTTWPGYVEGSLADIASLDPTDLYQRAPGLWMSPAVPAEGLTTKHAKKWQKLWSVANYEPDVVTAMTLGGGALASFDGYLYFGTMQVPLTGAIAFSLMYGWPSNSTLSANWMLSDAPTMAIYTNTYRPTSLFRVRNFRTPVVVQGSIRRLGGDFELLYGYRQMPTYVPSGSPFALTNWVWKNNLMDQTPSMGSAQSGGFGDPANEYTWSMAVFQNNLYVGTYDDTTPLTKPWFDAAAANPNSNVGADLYRLTSSQASRFRAVSTNGLGNIATYGFRTMAADAKALYIGTANPRNLLVNPTNTTAYGGWELLRLTHRKSVATDVDADFEADAAWATAGAKFVVIRSQAGTVSTNYAGTAASLPAWADYDRDGLADPAWCDPATGVWTAWLSSRDGQQTTLAKLKLKAAVPVPADLDGDGKADLALCSPADGTITWLSGVTGKTSKVAPGKKLTAFPAVADYNGDGTAELVWYVPPGATATGQIIRSSSTTAAALTTQPLAGSFKGVPVPADYDGDGRADFALHDPVSGVIHVWRSTDSTHVFSGAPAGTGWLPMVADYDGDGKADFAWYDPLFAQLYIEYSAGGTLTSAVPVETPGARPVTTPAAVWYTK